MLSPRRKASAMPRFTLDRNCVMNASFIEPSTGSRSEEWGVALSKPSSNFDVLALGGVGEVRARDEGSRAVHDHALCVEARGQVIHARSPSSERSLGFTGTGASAHGNVRPESQARIPSRHDSLRASRVRSRIASSGSRLSMEMPVKAAWTSSVIPAARVLAGACGDGRRVVGSVDLAINIFVREGEGLSGLG